MGRWSQQSRRGGGGGAPTAITPNIVNLLDVHGDGTGWVLTFDGPISCNVGLGDTEFEASDATTSTCAGAAGNQCSISDDSSLGYIAGFPWQLTGQPNWLNTPVVFPAAGTTT